MLSVVVECELGGYEQKLQPGNPDGIVLNASKDIRIIGGNFLGAGLCEDLVVSPEVIGQHHNLKVGIVIFELGRGDCIQALPLGLPDQVLCIGPFVVLGSNLVGLSPQIGTKHPVSVSVLFKEFPLKGLGRRRALFFRDPHSHKPALELPANGLVDTAVVLDRASPPGLVPVPRIKRGLGSLVGNDEMEAGFGGCKNTLPTEKLSIGSQKNFFHTARQMVLDLTDEGGAFLSVQNVSLPEFTRKILSGLIHKTQHWTVCLLASMAGVVSHASPLLIAINRFRSGIDTQMDPFILQGTQLPGPFPQGAVHLENALGLVDAEAVHISPEGAGSRQTGQLEKSANHRVQPDIDKMPQAIETDKEQHQNPDNHAVVTQLGLSTRPTVNMIENFLKPQQVQKLDQPQKASKGAKPLPASAVTCGSSDFPGARGSSAKSFTGAILRDSLTSFLNHLGYLLSFGISFCKPNNNRIPRWFSIFYSPLGAKSR